jgi:hypothetical protein
VADETDVPREIAEAALAHTLENKVEAAYRRTDFLAKRRALMERWADYCLPLLPERIHAKEDAASEVTALYQ